ncbi:MAG: UPF0149 family protein [Methylococcales bacterium]|nr:UPF0149 family protein [Methylococcales bacterium]
MYQVLNEMMERLHTGIGVSEAHGMATGMLSIETRMDAGDWLGELTGAGASLPDSSKAALLTWFETIRLQLIDANNEFVFDLCLPDQDEPLTEQAEALRNWCAGFLFGIGHEQSDGNWPGEIGEIMRDLIELTKIDTDIHDEEDANALTEIHEYLRAAVFIVRDYFSEAGHGKSH